jgi:hypothetical protein
MLNVDSASEEAADDIKIFKSLTSKEFASHAIFHDKVQVVLTLKTVVKGNDERVVG